MKNLLLAGLIGLCCGIASCSFFAKEIVLDGFEGELTHDTVDYGSGGGAIFNVSAEKTLKVDGEQSIKLDYDISQGGYLWAARGYNLDVKGAACWSVPAQKINWKRFNAFSLYMYGTNSGGKVAFDIKDKGAEMWRFVLDDNFEGWKEIVIPFGEFFARSDWQPYNAEKNGTIDFPIMSFQFEPRRPDAHVYYFDRVGLVRIK
ncbi:MAG: carbohydrate binding domain-containing protein [Candidatus Omnitrophica bacterium]|nr:carbohydrate binding domain-containing protein [Candidatus Omnitrophota bacterium]